MENDRPHLLTSLCYAASKGYTAIVDMLLKQGSPVDARATDGSTALMWAARKGNIDTVKLLLKNGADPGARDGKGRTALDYAAEKGQKKIIEFLRGYPDAK
jgi:ankyrin repeat protein